MKILSKLALAGLVICSATIARADWVSGYYKSNGTYVAPYYRTPANGTPYDNLSYRGYPSQQPGYVSPRSSGFDSGLARPTPLPSFGSFKSEPMPHPCIGGSYTPTPLYRRSSSSGF